MILKKFYTTFLLIAVLAFMFLLLGGCADENVSVIFNPSTDIHFSISKQNTDSDYCSIVKSSTFKRYRSSWFESDSLLLLFREITFDLELENDELIEFGIRLKLLEPNRDLLSFEDNGNWHYNSINDETFSMLNNYSSAMVMVNSSVIFCGSTDECLQIVDVKIAEVNGVEMSYISLNFKGDAYGWYDPRGEHSAVYKLAEGSYNGVFEYNE